MKKLLLALSIMLGFTAVVSAQSATQKTTATPAAVKPVAAPAKVVTMKKTETKPVAVKAATPSATAAKPLKADGTPDMRFKENNKAAKPVAGPKKADGTPDLRYKENKKAKGKS